MATFYQHSRCTCCCEKGQGDKYSQMTRKLMLPSTPTLAKLENKGCLIAASPSLEDARSVQVPGQVDKLAL